MRTRVLQVIQNLNYGGMERLLADIVQRADRERFDCHVLVLQYLGRFAEGLQGVATLHVAGPMPKWSLLWPAALTEQIGRIAPDVVHTHSGVWYKASLAARRARVPRVIHTEHGRASPDPMRARLIDRMASRRTDVVVAVSDALARTLVDTGVSEARRVRVVRNGVDTELHHPRADAGAVRSELGLAPSTPVLGSIGRLERIKGYDIMIEALAALRAGWAGDPDATPVLMLAGEGSERAHLEELAERRGVRDAVHFLGWRDDVRELHATFTLFTLSSRSEGTSVSLLEAMSAGRCPVVTDVGGNAAILGEELRHRLVPPTDPGALAAAWRDALTGHEGRRRDEAAARARVCRHFALEAMVRAYEGLYAAA